MPAWLGKPYAERERQSPTRRGCAFGWQSHLGITTVAVYNTGLLFGLTYPLTIDHPPFCIPFADLTATQADW